MARGPDEVLKELFESEQWFSLAFAHERDAISVFDAETQRFIDVNEAWVGLYGYSREEALSMTPADVSDEQEATRASIEERAAGKASRGRALLVAASVLVTSAAAFGGNAKDASLATGGELPPCPAGDHREGATCVSSPLFGDDYDTNIYSLFGLRGSLARGAAHDRAVGVSLISEGVSYGSGSLVTLRLAHLAFLGAGADGVEGGLGLDYAMGLRARLGPHHGPFARLGLRAHLLGNQKFYSSRVELPQLQLGYQLLDQRMQLELGGRGGFVLIGRQNALDGRRPLGDALDFGGYTALRFESLRLEADCTRTRARSSAPGTPVDELSGLLCGIAPPFGVCLDARYYRGDVRTGQGVRLAQSTYVGLAIGAGVQATP